MSLTLRNFEDLLDPASLDAGRDFYGKNGLMKFSREPGFASAEFNHQGNACEIGLELSGERVAAVECGCSDFHENWEDEPCLHLAAMLYALKAGPQAAKTQRAAAETADTTNDLPVMPTKRGRPKSGAPTTAPKPAKVKEKKPPAKPKDPAEALLGELEPREIYEFVRQMVLKNKDFKSQFLIHFSEKNAGNDQQFNDIVTNAIAAVRGRRKYLKGADGVKISSALTPLYKQAAASESHGYFREAFAICKSFLQHLPKVFASMDTPSARLDTLMENSLELISLIIKSNATPFEFRGEVFDTLMQEYKTITQEYSGSFKDEVYKRLIESARATQRLEDLGELHRSEVARYQAMTIKNHWDGNYYLRLSTIRQAIAFFEKELHSEARAVALMEENKGQMEIYLDLIRKKIDIRDFATAEKYILDLRKNQRKYDSRLGAWHLDQTLEQLTKVLKKKQLKH